jgi:hypothetical protein
LALIGPIGARCHEGMMGRFTGHRPNTKVSGSLAGPAGADEPTGAFY